MNNTREVRFDEWCPKCKNADTPETDDPCNGCLQQGWNIDSHQPVNFREKE